MIKARRKSVVVVAHATCLTLSDRGPRNSSCQWARCTPVVGLTLEHHTGMELKWREIFSSSLTRYSANKTFDPTDLMSTYSVGIRRVFGLPVRSPML
ncbi:hypothetical protein TNCV_5029961 [Trichonephila clavipes]|nr:hypothetical protein TNCV_5029961 [Trichonephila clavipes]